MLRNQKIDSPTFSKMVEPPILKRIKSDLSIVKNDSEFPTLDQIREAHKSIAPFVH